jgi:CCR4-NOT transcription complex subunit 6
MVDDLWHATPGMKITPQYHMPSLFVDAHNPPPPLPSDVHLTYAWLRGPKMPSVQEGLVAHARPENKEAVWTKVSSKRNYTPTSEDTMRLLKFVIYVEHKPGRHISQALASSSSPTAESQSSSSSYTLPSEASKPFVAAKNTYFVAPVMKKAPVRQLTSRKTDIEMDLLPEVYNFTAMSWNILARRYTDRRRLSNCPDYALEWEYRKEMIMDENLLVYSPDLVSLQECEDDAMDSFYHPTLKSHGYSSLFEKRGSVNHDGCAIFYKRSKFRFVSSQKVDFNDLDKDKDLKQLQYPSATFVTNNVAVISLLEVKHAESHLENVYGKRYIWVVNTHNFADPHYPHIKLLQGHYLLERLQTMRNDLNASKGIPMDTPIVLTGDLNSTHKSALYAYLTHGSLDSHGASATQTEDQTSHSTHFETSSHLDRLIKEVARTKSLKHPITLRNAHQAHGDAVTNLTINFAGCLDYIFHTKSLVPLAVLENPTTSDNPALRDSILTDDYMGCIPNPSYPSDHLPLMVQFAFALNPEQAL